MGMVADGTMKLNDTGRLIEIRWRDLPNHHPGLRLDLWVVMPDHLHGILILPHGVSEHWSVRRNIPVDKPDVSGAQTGAQQAAPLQESRLGDRPRRNTSVIAPGSLGVIIRSFKSSSSRAVNLAADTPGASFWQRNYYEHIIRDGVELAACRQYIKDNPANWDKHPDPDTESHTDHHKEPL